MSEIPLTHEDFEQPPKQHVVVEVGAGRYSDTNAFQSIVERRHFEPDQQYVGIDLGVRGGFTYDEAGSDEVQDGLMRQGWNNIKNDRPDEAIEFLHADGTKLPLKDETADEVILSNVFGFGADTDSRPALLREANRVLKPNGIIVIQDDTSPYHASQERMNAEATAAGLIPDEDNMLLVRQDQHPDEYHRLTLQYGFDTNTLFKNNIIWLIQKLAPEQPPEQPPKVTPAKLRWWRRT
jgi:SAM-dependent methyltransferase